MFRKIICNFLLLLIVGSPVMASDVLDGIAATVDEKIILISEIRSQIDLMLMQMPPDEAGSINTDSLFENFLTQMIDDKLLLIEAEKDTTIEVTKQNIEDALNEHIERIKTQFPSEQAFQTQLRSEGMTYRELRERYKDEIRNQLYKEQFLNRRLGSATISSGEVREFYDTYSDSLPRLPAGIHLSHILFVTQPGETTRDSLYRFAELVLAKAKAGENFAELARNFSNDNTADVGGELGWFGKGDMVAEFEEAVFSLEIGEISNIVETQFGFHIIKVTDKKEAKRQASHILIKFDPSEKDLQISKAQADSIYSLLVAGADFAEMAREHSDDVSTAQQGGDLGWYASDNLFEQFKIVVANHEAGEIAEPVKSQYGYHIVKVIEKNSSRKLDFKENYNEIEHLAQQYKARQEMVEWLDDIREKHYIEIK